MAFRFPRKERLKSQKLIDQLFSEGQAITDYPLRLIFLECPLPAEVRGQATVAVPKRTFRKAVARNRIKRLMRESYRQRKAHVFNNIEGNFAFLFLYIGREIPTFKEVDRSMRSVLQKLIARKNDEEAPV